MGIAYLNKQLSPAKNSHDEACTYTRVCSQPSFRHSRKACPRVGGERE